MEQLGPVRLWFPTPTLPGLEVHPLHTEHTSSRGDLISKHYLGHVESENNVPLNMQELKGRKPKSWVGINVPS